MSAVRGEVEDLKEKIVRLEEHMARIQIENQILREHVPNEVGGGGMGCPALPILLDRELRDGLLQGFFFFCYVNSCPGVLTLRK